MSVAISGSSVIHLLPVGSCLCVFAYNDPTTIHVCRNGNFACELLYSADMIVGRGWLSVLYSDPFAQFKTQDMGKKK